MGFLGYGHFFHFLIFHNLFLDLKNEKMISKQQLHAFKALLESYQESMLDFPIGSAAYRKFEESIRRWQQDLIILTEACDLEEALQKFEQLRLL